MKTRTISFVLALLLPCVGAHTAEAQTNSPQPMAIERLKPLAENGDAAAMRAYGLRHWMGIYGAPQDPVAALGWIRKGAEKGDAMAQTIMALASIRGYQSEVNEAEALRWARLASDQGNDNSKRVLAQLYRMGIGVPRTPEEEPERLLAMLERKANAEAMVIRAWEFLLSEEGRRDIPKAWDRLMQAIEAGGQMRDAGFNLVTLRNLAEPPRDPVERYVWAYIRTEARHPLALHIMGEAFSTKEMGPVDYVKAIGWFQKAADAGHLPAWERLGYLHEKGLGVSTNSVRAAECYLMASTNLPAAKEALERLTKQTGGRR